MQGNWQFNGFLLYLIILSTLAGTFSITGTCLHYLQKEKIYTEIYMDMYTIYKRNLYIFLNRTKPTKWHVRPAKTRISLGIRTVWSESSLSAWGKLGLLATHWAHSEDSDQTGWMPRLTWVFAGRTLILWFCHVAAQIYTYFLTWQNKGNTSTF